MTRKLAFIILALLPMGCAGIPKAYVEADLKTYEAVAPEYLQYVDQDEELSPTQKDLRHGTVQSWQRRIKAAQEVQHGER